MGKCVLSFDQIEIINKKSDTSHSDNDWMVITWFVADKIVRTDKFPLYNTRGSVVLDSGDAIAPFTSEVDCPDDKVAIATYSIVNLGSSDYSDQVNAIGGIAEDISQEVAKAYLKAVELYFKYGDDVPGLPAAPEPFATLLADAVDAISPYIVKEVGAVFEDVIIPLLNDLVNELNVLLGHPNCNGDVLQDVVIYAPAAPDVSMQKIYQASSKTGCGSPARTRVNLTVHRELDPQMQFANTPPPQVDTVPSVSADGWVGSWAEDSTTPVPIITIMISPSQKSTGQLAVRINEHVDPRFDVRFVAAADPVQPHKTGVFPFTGNVFGTVRPWVNHPLTPTELSVAAVSKRLSPKATPAVPVSAARGKIAKKMAQARTTGQALANKTITKQPVEKFVFRLGWKNSVPLAGPSLVPIKTGVAGLGGSAVQKMMQDASVIELPAQGVTLALYQFQVAGNGIGYGVRYMRAQSLSFTLADVMLVNWDPLH